MIPEEINLPDEVGSAELVADRRGSRIWRTTLTDGRVIAVKYATDGGPQRDGRMLAAREAAVLHHIGTDGYLYASGETDAGTWLAVTWISAPTLLDRWKPLRADTGPAARASALRATWQAAETLAGWHERGWLHADLQASHIYVPDNQPAQLIDLALAQGPVGLTPDVTYRGGLAHLTAPEIAAEILETSADHTITLTPAAEVYMLGAVLFAAWTKQWPCDYRTSEPSEFSVTQVHASIRQPDSRRSLPQGWPQAAMWLEAMLSHAPAERPTMAEVRSAVAGQLSDLP